MSLEVCPMTLKEANAFVEQHHRGSDRIEIYDLGHQETPCWFVTCNDCGAEISGFWQESGAISAWNRRTDNG